MTVYVDSSSLVKLYINEPGSSVVEELLTNATAIATSALAYPEVRSTFARRRRDRTITAREFTAAQQQFDADWATLIVLPCNDVLARRAGELAEEHKLRGADAVHLAAFERLLIATDDDEVEFSCADDRLNQAARRLG